MRFVAIGLGVLLFASSAFAQKIAIVMFTGPGANEVRNQLVSELCDRADCSAQTKVISKGKIDWKKVKKERVKFVLEGKVVAKGKKKTIELQVLTKPGAGKTKSFNLEEGELSDRNLKAAGAALGALMGLPGKDVPEEKPPLEEKKKPEERRAAVEEKPIEEEAKPAAKENRTVSEPKPSPKKEEPVDEELKPLKRPIIALEAGLAAASKSFSYSQVATPNLRSYRAPFIFGPNLKAELYPLAIFSDGIGAGLGFEAGYFVAVGLKSRRTGSDVTYPTSISRIDLALKFQIRPSQKSEAHVAPFIGYRLHTFSVAPGGDGSVLDGLPAITYAALKFGLGGELPLGDTGLLVFGKFAVLPVLSAPEILSTYFPSGSAIGLDGGLGLGLKLPFLQVVQLRLAFDFARYGLTFRSQPMDTYVAEGAVDQYLGGSFALCFAN